MDIHTKANKMREAVDDLAISYLNEERYDMFVNVKVHILPVIRDNPETAARLYDIIKAVN